jgi:hypothetical protein
MTAPVTVEQVMELARQLTPEEQQKVAAQLQANAKAKNEGAKQAKRSILDLAGTLPSPAYGEEAQACISRMRMEWDEREQGLGAK